ncbi:hemerythrin domain-containing protein [Thalassorhabdus alkalitolerans]|uniref:Hemerythrin domain-containing protein n=1 Tax=Thalassorhabdus alkalitolerans TaxID=2282697 RepID=A0ABW0YMH2_9BACI
MKYELFMPVHKGLRFALTNLLNQANQLNFENNERLAAFSKNFLTLSAVLHSHAEHEDEHVEPAVIKYAPEVARKMDQEHKATNALLIELENLVKEINESPTKKRRELGVEFVYAYNKFLAAYLNHLQTEEVDVMDVLWHKLSTEELEEITVAIRSAIPPEILMDYFRYMIPGQNIFERVEMLTGMKKFAPEELYKEACDLAESVLPDEDWNELKKELDAA